MRSLGLAQAKQTATDLPRLRSYKTFFSCPGTVSQNLLTKLGRHAHQFFTSAFCPPQIFVIPKFQNMSSVILCLSKHTFSFTPSLTNDRATHFFHKHLFHWKSRVSTAKAKGQEINHFYYRNFELFWNTVEKNLFCVCFLPFVCCFHSPLTNKHNVPMYKSPKDNLLRQCHESWFLLGEAGVSNSMEFHEL